MEKLICGFDTRVQEAKSLCRREGLYHPECAEIRDDGNSEGLFYFGVIAIFPLERLKKEKGVKFSSALHITGIK